jgi:hypothetical protein
MSMQSEPSVEFIRLFFKSPKQEELAVRCAQSIACLVGHRVVQLRPDTTWSEIFGWRGLGPANAALFMLALRRQFGPCVKELNAASDFMTFREFIEYVCGREHSRA